MFLLFIAMKTFEAGFLLNDFWLKTLVDWCLWLNDKT